ncbi:MAG: hypothetical protein OFPI_18520 [Osedax symbiont Rs2]|nr:MAG: hypothetical protein OFPI_18520 [Osedax symbiont Rs2]
MDAPAIAQLKILDNKTSSPSKAIETALPVGKTVTAKITQVSPEQARQDSHRVKLEINKSLLQISAKFSGSVPEKGSTVSLQRSASGQIQLSLINSSDSALKQPAGNQTSSPAAPANNTAANNKTSSQSSSGTAANTAANTTGSEQSSASSSAALTAKIAANNLSPLLAANVKTTSQATPNSVTLKVPVTINASGTALNIIEQALPKGETLSARVINQVLTNSSANKPATANLNSQATVSTSTSSPTTTPTNNSVQQATTNNQSSGNSANGVGIGKQTLNLGTTNSLNNSPTNSPTIVQANAASVSGTGTGAASTATNQPAMPAQAGTATQASTQAQTTQVPAATTTPNVASTATGAKPSATASSPSNSAVATASSAQSSQLASSTATVSQSAATVSGATATSSNNLQPTALSSTTNTPARTTVVNNPSQQAPATSTAGSGPTNFPANTTPTSQQVTARAAANSAVSSPTINSSATNTAAANPLTSSPQVQTSNVNSQLLGAISRPVIQAAPASGAALPGTALPSTALNSPALSTTQGSTTLAPSTPLPVASTTGTATDKGVVSNLPTNPTTTALPGSKTTVTPQNQQLNNLQAQTTAIKISVAGQQVSLQGPANLPPLQNVQITRINGPQANIQWQQPSQPSTLAVAVPATLSTRQVQVVEQSLRQALPQQIPIAEGINQLVAQSVQIANSSSNINAPVDKIALSIMQMFGVKPGALSSSATIKRNVQHGGLFTESKLLNHSPGNQGDMKNFLSKLKQLAKQLPAEQKDMLVNTTDRMLARITASQLTHVQQQHAKAEISNERTFQVDIPVQQNEKLDNVEMEIKQRKHRNEQGEFISVWSVKLHFDLAEHGEVDAEVALNPTDNSISTTFLCTNLNTVRQIERAMPSFRQQLNQQGFEINTLHCTQGSQADAAANNPINKRIIDIRT